MEDQTLQAIRKRLHDVLPDDLAALGDALAGTVFRRTPARQTAQLDPDEAADWLRGAVRLLTERAPGELIVQADVAASGNAVVQVVVEDAPFLFSTVLEALEAMGLPVADVAHALIGVQRDASGRLTAVTSARAALAREAYLRVELGTALDAGDRREVSKRLQRVLEDVLAVAADAAAMRQRLLDAADGIAAHGARVAPAEEAAEVAELLRWLAADRFVFQGARRLERGGVVADSELGILRLSRVRIDPLWHEHDLDGGAQDAANGARLFSLLPTADSSTVHRRERLLLLDVPERDAHGRVTAREQFVGLLSARALAEPSSNTPVLRARLAAVLEGEEIVPGSYDEHQLRGLFDALPKPELFALSVPQLRAALVDLLVAGRRQAVRTLWLGGHSPSQLSLLLALPRSRYGPPLVTEAEQAFRRHLDVDHIEHHLSLPGGDQLLVHFVLRAVGRTLPTPGSPQLDALDAALRTMARSWEDELAAELVRRHGPDGAQLAATWAGRFGPGYRDATPAKLAADDVAELAALEQGDPERMVLRAAPVDDGDPAAAPLRLRLYSTGAAVELSAFLPVLESLGFVVVEEVPHVIDMPGGVQWLLHDFGLRQELPDPPLDLDADATRIAAAAAALWRGRAAVDSLNRLVLRANLTWHDVVILRAYRRYRRQLGTTFTEAYLNDALLDAPDVAQALVAYFHERFDPGRSPSPEREAAARQAVLRACDRVERFDQDRILRGFLELVDATVRTNRWAPPRPDGPGADPRRRALALKFDPARIADLPKPVPHAEVFVYSPQMEGVHLRGGRVARGGVRWSDRQEDFRTEVLGLMKAQMTKNAVIVPAGAKGGFVLRQRDTPDPAAVERAYITYIRALLDVTDNIVDGRVQPPPGVRRADGDDPYLVVAADRGTASLSDTANALSQAYGYWLGDAFASGGSTGYDHKDMGITARGAWVSVRRHFRELGIDVQTEPITVVGIGDMSGDVFGNGMLQSHALRLVAAFDHRDVFLDPDPDPQASFEERRRLFNTPRSSWQDYDRRLLSPSGGVWSRTTKAIPLDDRLRALLRVDADSLSPPQVISAVLRMPCDLLFAGGIGTFVKASDESHADVGDKANDAIRINADELAARVVGEGGNLAMTQRARVQYARRGGRCNADFVDNAAGVATSDREVNLKILFDRAQQVGRLDPAERGRLLRNLTEHVAEGALRDVYLQTWAISQELHSSPRSLERYERLMAELEADRGSPAALDRAVECLPSTVEMQERRAAGAGLTRPEIAVLLAYTKRDLANRLAASSLPDVAALAGALLEYFPAPVRERFGDLVHDHPLRRELLATVVANDLVNRLGATYVDRTRDELGVEADDVAAAYWAAREVTGADRRWRSIEALDDRCDPELQLELKAAVDHLVDELTRSYLRESRGVDLHAVVERDAPVFAALERTVGKLGSSGQRRQRAAAVERYLDLGIAEDLAATVVGLDELCMVPDVAEVALRTGRSATDVLQTFLRLGESLPLDALGQRLATIEPRGHWQQAQHRGLADDLRNLRRDAAERALRLAADAAAPDDLGVARLLEELARSRERVQVLIGQVEREGGGSLDAIAVAVRTLRQALDL